VADLHLISFDSPQEKFSRTNQYTDPIPFAFQVMGRPAKGPTLSSDQARSQGAGERSLEDRRALSSGDSFFFFLLTGIDLDPISTPAPC
jgi:hypothetical protein